MADKAAEEGYNLFQENIIMKLKDRDWYIDCMNYNFEELAKTWGCTVINNRRRLGEAYDYWLEDAGRALKEDMDKTEELDHFKHSAFISFWLRRRIPINRVYVRKKLRERDVDIVTATDAQKFFLRHPDEICSFFVGFQICIFYHTILVLASPANLIQFGTRANYLRLMKIDPDFVKDIVTTLKHKSMSPHSLYLIYKSLFTVIGPGAPEPSSHS